jgi:hypothetical protein
MKNARQHEVWCRFKSDNINKNPDKRIFNWDFDGEYFVHQKSLEFFAKNTLPVLRSLEKRLVTWAEIKHSYRHAHRFNAGYANGIFRRIFKELCKKKEIEEEAFYQFPGELLKLHRIIGYRANGGIFYLVLDDEMHEVLPGNQ